jgi:hypothetical protein
VTSASAGFAQEASTLENSPGHKISYGKLDPIHSPQGIRTAGGAANSLSKFYGTVAAQKSNFQAGMTRRSGSQGCLGDRFSTR